MGWQWPPFCDAGVSPAQPATQSDREKEKRITARHNRQRKERKSGQRGGVPGRAKTYTPRRAPTRLPGLEHQHAPPTRDQLARGKGARDAAADDDYIRRGRQIGGGSVAQQLLGRVAVPVRVRAARRRQLSLAVL